MKKLLSLVLCLVMIVALASVGTGFASADNAELKPVKLIAYCPGSGVPYQTLVKYSELVAEASNGAIIIKAGYLYDVIRTKGVVDKPRKRKNKKASVFSE